MDPQILDAHFFMEDAALVAARLLGKILRVSHPEGFLAVRIVETEAYYMTEKASHASLGRTPSREALFQPPGTIYMYYSRGGDSLNFSVRGPGNAVLIKAAIPWLQACSTPRALEIMHARNPVRGSGKRRGDHRLCAGQTLICRSLGLTVPVWNGRCVDHEGIQLLDGGFHVARYLRTRRLGIAPHRDAHLLLRFLDPDYRHACTQDPTRSRSAREGKDFLYEKMD